MWILTTTGRPKECAEAIAAIDDTCSEGFSCVLFVDGNVEGYEDVELPNADRWTKIISERNIGLTVPMNNLLRDYPDAKFYGWLADDFRPRTQDWDKDISEASLPHFIAYCNDGWLLLDREGFVPHITSAFAVGGDLVREVGWFSPPPLRQAGIDSVWNQIGRRCRIQKYLSKTIVEHVHWKNGKRDKDPIDDFGNFRSVQFVNFVQDEIENLCLKVNQLIAVN